MVKQTLVEVRNLRKLYPVKGQFLSRRKEFIHSVDDISFSIKEGDTFALVGETGSGKSTTGRMLARLVKPTSGAIFFEGKNVLKFKRQQMQNFRRQVQMVFQDPFSSLNPRMKVGQIIGSPLRLDKVTTKSEARTRVLDVLERVGLSPANNFIDRFPHEFSGGQRQRIGIARALILKPKLIIADEPVSALDVSVRAQIINLMNELQKDFALTYFFIAHDMSVVRHVSDTVAVMYLGKIVEMALTKDLFENPLHPYTKALLSAVPIPDPTIQRVRERLQGELPSPINPPKGCYFNTRCPISQTRCFSESPELVEIEPDHYAACHLVRPKMIFTQPPQGSQVADTL